MVFCRMDGVVAIRCGDSARYIYGATPLVVTPQTILALMYQFKQANRMEPSAAFSGVAHMARVGGCELWQVHLYSVFAVPRGFGGYAVPISTHGFDEYSDNMLDLLDSVRDMTAIASAVGLSNTWLTRALAELREMVEEMLRTRPTVATYAYVVEVGNDELFDYVELRNTARLASKISDASERELVDAGVHRYCDDSGCTRLRVFHDVVGGIAYSVDPVEELGEDAEEVREGVLGDPLLVVPLHPVARIVGGDDEVNTAVPTLRELLKI